MESLLGNYQLDFVDSQKLQDKVRVVLDVDVVEVGLGKEQLKTMSSAGVGVEAPSREKYTKDGEWIFNNRKPLLLADLGQKSGQAAPVSLNRPRINGYLGVPIYARGGEMAGVLRVLSYPPRNFSNELELLQQVAGCVGIALENTRLHEQSRDQALKLEIANQKLTDQATELNRSNHELEQFAHALSRDMRAATRGDRLRHRLTKHYGSKLMRRRRNSSITLATAPSACALISDVLVYAGRLTRVDQLPRSTAMRCWPGAV